MDDKQEAPKRKSTAGKILRITFRIILGLILLIAVVAVLILTPPVQNFIKSKATTWLSKKLDTKVSVGRIYIGFPKKVVLEDIYVEDRQKDTLLAGGSVKVDISMLKLLKSEVEVSQVQLSEITAKVKRVLPDTVYNFQFIIDAFATGDTTAADPADSSSMKITVKGVELDKIRIVYDDDVTGNDMTLWLGHFDTDIDVFDLDNMRFEIPETNLSGIRAKIYQHKPLVEAAEVADSVEVDTASVMPAIAIGEFNVSDIQLDYGNDVSALYTKMNLGKLTLESDNIDLQNQNIVLDNILLENTTATVRLGKKDAAALVAEEAKQEALEKTPGSAEQQQKEAAEAGGMRVFVKNIRLNNNNLAFANDNDPVAPNGMDFSHLDIKGLTLHADDFLFSTDSIAGSITRGELTDRSGFELETFETEFLYAANEAYLHNLLIETPGTTIRRSLTVRYPSLEALQKDIGQLQINLDLDDSRIQVKDILTFAPFLAAQPAFSNPQATWLIDGNVTGRVANLNINSFHLRAFNNTDLRLNGHIAGLPDAKKVSGNLNIANFSTSRSDIMLLAPKGSLPENITLPNTLALKGSVAGSMNNARANLTLNTNLGSAALKGNISNPTDSLRAKYNVSLETRAIDLGVIMQNDSMFGPLTASLTAAGTGFTPKVATAVLDATIHSAELNRYTYQNVKMHGNLASQKGSVLLNINDPNLTVVMNATADLAGDFPAVELDGTIDSISLKPLNFTTDTLVYKGNIAANFRNTDPDNLDGELFVTRSGVTMGSSRYKLDTIALRSGANDKGKFLQLTADGVHVELSGQYKLTQLGSVIQQTIQPYYALSDSANKDTIDTYDFAFTGEVQNTPTIQAFVPALTSFEPIKLNGRFATNKGFNTTLDAPLIMMGTNRIQELKLNAGTNNKAIAIRTSLRQFAAGQSLTVYTTNIDANIADNKIGFLINFKDIDDKNKYRFGGIFSQTQPGAYALTMEPEQLLLNYDVWKIADSNLIRLTNGDINIRQFIISRGGQQLSINSSNSNENSPLEVKFGNFRIGTLTAFAKQDTTIADGTMNGGITLNNLATQMTFTGNLNITDLMFRSDTVGNLALKVNNTTENVYNADIRLTGKGNELLIAGNYNVRPAAAGIMDLTMDIRRLQMKSIEAMSMGAISEATGYLTGRFDVNGTFEKPEVVGQLNFNNTAFSPSMLGSRFAINNESIRVNNQGINFDTFKILDSSRNELELDGWAYTTNFTNYRLDLDLTADNFQALSSTKQDNKLFFGQFYFDTDMHIGGTESAPVIDGRLNVNEKTDMTIVMPQQDPGIIEREGIVRFVDMDSVAMDTTLLITAVDSLAKSDITGMNITMNIETSKEAKFTLVIDEGNGDFLEMQGTAQLTGGIDPSGKTTLTGNYEIEQGSYQLSINLLKRKFDILKGSTITWLGEPTKADLNLTAVYVANTAPITLVEDQANVSNINVFKQKLPFNVDLVLKGELLKPDITFNVRLPDADSAQLNVAPEVTETVETRLALLRTQPSELNKQVFALLLLNRFVAENPFASGGDAMTAESVARQSVSRLLSEQLNSLAADLISGVDVNFDLESSDDYTSGSRQNRTDLNVSLSKELLNDRLRVTVGNNFELEGPQSGNRSGAGLAGNVAVDYLLSKDGRYMLRGFRKNEYEGELDGYIIETGLNFILTFDYDNIRELFHSPKPKNSKARKKS